jgi:hypothetical protein
MRPAALHRPPVDHHRRAIAAAAEEVLRVRDRLARLGGQCSQNGWDAMPSTWVCTVRGDTKAVCDVLLAAAGGGVRWVQDAPGDRR